MAATHTSPGASFSAGASSSQAGASSSQAGAGGGAFGAELFDWKSVGGWPTSYVCYLIRVQHGTDAWITERRYSEFHALHAELEKEASLSASSPLRRSSLPPKGLSVSLPTRARGLAEYVRILVEDGGCRGHGAVRAFFDIPEREPPISVISIPSTSTAGSGNGYTLYRMCLTLRGETTAYCVDRRYSEFRKLHKVLTSAYNVTGTNPFLSLFPPAKRFGKLDPKVVEERQVALEAYLKFVVLHPVFGTHPDVLEFCGVNAHLLSHSLAAQPDADLAVQISTDELSAYLGVPSVANDALYLSHASDM